MLNKIIKYGIINNQKLKTKLNEKFRFREESKADIIVYYVSTMCTNIKNHCGQHFIIALSKGQIIYRTFQPFGRFLLSDVT